MEARTELAVAAALSNAGPYADLHEGRERALDLGILPACLFCHSLPGHPSENTLIFFPLNPVTLSLTGPSSIMRSEREILWQTRGRRNGGGRGAL